MYQSRAELDTLPAEFMIAPFLSRKNGIPSSIMHAVTWYVKIASSLLIRVDNRQSQSLRLGRFDRCPGNEEGLEVSNTNPYTNYYVQNIALKWSCC